MLKRTYLPGALVILMVWAAWQATPVSGQAWYHTWHGAFIAMRELGG